MIRLHRLIVPRPPPPPVALELPAQPKVRSYIDISQSLSPFPYQRLQCGLGRLRWDEGEEGVLGGAGGGGRGVGHGEGGQTVAVVADLEFQS